MSPLIIGLWMKRSCDHISYRICVELFFNRSKRACQTKFRPDLHADQIMYVVVVYSQTAHCYCDIL